MKSTELNKMITIDDHFKKELLGQKGIVTNTMLKKDFQTGNAESIRLQLAILGGNTKGELLTVDIPIDKLSHDVNQGDVVSLKNISGVQVRGISREGSTYVDYLLVLEGTIDKEKVK